MEEWAERKLEKDALDAILMAEDEAFSFLAPIKALFEWAGWRVGGPMHANGMRLKVHASVWRRLCGAVGEKAKALHPEAAVHASLAFMNWGPSAHEEADENLVLVGPGFLFEREEAA